MTALLVLSIGSLASHATPVRASRQAHRWLHRRAASAGEWATIIDPTDGSVRARYVRRADGSIARMQ